MFNLVGLINIVFFASVAVFAVSTVVAVSTWYSSNTVVDKVKSVLTGFDFNMVVQNDGRLHVQYPSDNFRGKELGKLFLGGFTCNK